MTKERKQWDVNDYAFIIYADRKGLKGTQISAAMEISLASYYTHAMYLRDPGKYGNKTKQIIHKAEVMAQSVLSGEYPDTRTVWNDRIEQASGLHFDLAPDCPVVPDTAPEPAPVIPAKLTLFEFSVNLEALEKIIRIIRG